nr:solute carrier family 35, member E1 [Ipomoea batatas]
MLSLLIASTTVSENVFSSAIASQLSSMACSSGPVFPAAIASDKMPGGHQPVDMLAHRHQYFSRHVSAFLGHGGLVLNVHSRRAALHKKLAELDGGGGAAEAGVTVGNDGLQVINEGHGIVRIIGEVGAGLVGSGVGGGALPAGDINGVQMLSHHGDLNRVKSAERSRRRAISLVILQRPPKLLRHLVRPVALPQVAA